MHSANFTALSRAVSFLFPPVAELLAVPERLALPELLAGVPELLAAPVSEGAFEPQPALITLTRATITRTASGRSVLFMVAPCVWKLG
jgi:hypothetical protein